MIKNTEKIDFFGWLILFICTGITYCLLLLIFKPLNQNWNIAWIGVIFGTFDLICILCIYISNIIYIQRELDKIEREKTWIEKALKKGI